MNGKIKQLIDSSQQIIQDCSLENGGIVAANTTKPYYSRNSANYFYIWPRDASYICAAADILEADIQKPFFNWLTDRPEDFKKEGLLFQRYAANGRLAGRQFQPDQMGSALWAIRHHFKNDLSKVYEYEVLIRRLADGLCDDWRETHFFHNSSDLWEHSERRTSSKMENNFTYSLAACARGLKFAYTILNNKQWSETADEMINKIEAAYSKEKKYFLRNRGKISDYNIDASLLGLVYPFDIIKADDERMMNTVKKIEEHLILGGGIHRFQFDYYDGEGTAQEGAGAWPLLNFWMSIYWSIYGDKEKALKYYDWVVSKIGDDNLIPEQIFDDFREGIKPLAWSHAMFIIASKYLGYIK